MAHGGHRLGHRLLAHQIDALLEDDATLVVHHVVELQEVLADVEVARLDLLLRLFERPVDPRMDDRLVLLEAELLQHAVHALGAEDAHQIVLQRQEEVRMAGVALAAGAAAELVVDAPALVALGADHVEAADGGRQRPILELGDLLADPALALVALGSLRHVGELVANAEIGIAAELDVGAAAGHVGGDGDGARARPPGR